VPASRLPSSIKNYMGKVKQLDFGLSVQPGIFEFGASHAITPTSLVIAYALAIAASGKASRVLLAGFDGYSSDDPRRQEMDDLLDMYMKAEGALPLLSITPTRYKIPTTSVYAF
jgi:4-hydroxy 2-oxovalerate aldolase